MSIIAIFRQSKASQKSSFRHLFNCNEITNQSPENNPNLNHKNIAVSIDSKTGKFISCYFSRNGKSEKIINKIEERAQELDQLSREDYKKHKTEEKTTMQSLGISKKIRTVLQSKKEQLQKEFLICFGNTSRSELMAHYKTPENLANACLVGALAVLKKKGLDKNNLISLVVHFDEKGLPHSHIIYNDYSFKEHTTATQIGCFCPKPRNCKKLSS
jgi:hypothetical protein